MQTEEGEGTGGGAGGMPEGDPGKTDAANWPFAISVARSAQPRSKGSAAKLVNAGAS